MSAPVDVLTVLDRAHAVSETIATGYRGTLEHRAAADDLREARAAVAELIEALAEARAYVRMCTPAPDLPAEAWGRVMDRTGAALTRCKGGVA